MKHIAIAAAILALAALPALATEATFERNLTVNGHVELSVSTGSGHIHITHGAGDRIHIFGRVKSNWGGSDEKVREIANNPPIEQTGNIVRIGSITRTTTTSASSTRSKRRPMRFSKPTRVRAT